VFTERYAVLYRKRAYAPRGDMMRKSVLFLFAFLLTAYSGWADGPRYVFEIRERAEPRGIHGR